MTNREKRKQAKAVARRKKNLLIKHLSRAGKINVVGQKAEQPKDDGVDPVERYYAMKKEEEDQRKNKHWTAQAGRFFKNLFRGSQRGA